MKPVSRKHMNKTIGNIGIGITLSLVLLCTGIPAVNAAFPDVGQSHLHYIAVNYLNDNSIAQGYSDGDFHPEDMIQRAEALKIILVSQGLTPSSTTETGFTDVTADDWFVGYVAKAKSRQIIQETSDGLFNPARNITRAEFIKMLLLANGFTGGTWGSTQMFSDVPTGAWFASYMNYAGKAGLLQKDQDNNLYPSQEMTRGEVAETIYFLYLIQNRANNSLLLAEADKHMAHLEYNLSLNNLVTAKKAAGIFVSITQQTYRNNPADKQSLGKAKLARAYDFLINGKIAKEHNNITRGEAWENLAKMKADEAKQIDSATSTTANSIETMTE